MLLVVMFSLKTRMILIKTDGLSNALNGQEIILQNFHCRMRCMYGTKITQLQSACSLAGMEYARRILKPGK